MNQVIEYNSYSAVVNFDSDDQVYYGKIIGIDDLVSFEGSSILEIELAFREALADYLETLQDFQGR